MVLYSFHNKLHSIFVKVLFRICRSLSQSRHAKCVQKTRTDTGMCGCFNIPPLVNKKRHIQYTVTCWPAVCLFLCSCSNFLPLASLVGSFAPCLKMYEMALNRDFTSMLKQAINRLKMEQNFLAWYLYVHTIKLSCH